MQRATVLQEEKKIERLASWIIQQGLVMPAVFLLEANKPFSFLGSQLLLLIQPLLAPVVGYDQIGAYAQLFEDRANIDRLLARLESRRVDNDDPASTGDMGFSNF